MRWDAASACCLFENSLVLCKLGTILLSAVLSEREAEFLRCAFILCMIYVCGCSSL